MTGTTQPEALRLAGIIDDTDCPSEFDVVAAELRRQHAEIERLRTDCASHSAARCEAEALVMRHEGAIERLQAAPLYWCPVCHGFRPSLPAPALGSCVECSNHLINTASWPPPDGWRSAILGAVARGWCHPKNVAKVMDSDLALAIAEEILALPAFAAPLPPAPPPAPPPSGTLYDCGECPRTDGCEGRCMKAPLPPAFQVTAKPLEWESTGHNAWNDTQRGFHIEFDREKGADSPYEASWGEGDPETFATLGEAIAWCQKELDDWVASAAVVVPSASTIAPEAYLLHAYLQAALRRLTEVVKSEPEAAPMKGWQDVMAERRRQVEVEGFTTKHDDDNNSGDLSAAACAYALAAADKLSPFSQGDGRKTPPIMWCWNPIWWKPGDPRRMLVKAGALILAEIERLDRTA